jgi:hypothetical protein
MKKKAAPSYPKPSSSALRSEDRKQRSQAVETKMPAVVDAAGLLSDLRSLIQSARQRIATVAYSTQTLLCWHVGRRLLRSHQESRIDPVFMRLGAGDHRLLPAGP